MYKSTYFVQNAMQAVPLSEFRARASAMIDLVEKGETVRILRHGKLVAEVVPVRVEDEDAPRKLPNWKRHFEPVKLAPGVSLTQAVLDERLESPW
jgi:antitoxin (DNA-binding transcriptional repressor) of toxin-antitoxin stability system